MSTYFYIIKFPFQSFYTLPIAFLLVLQVSLPGVVLCLGSDGHIEFENNTKSLCSESFANFDSNKIIDLNNNTGILSDTGHCGPCVDISISENKSEKIIVSTNNLDSQINMYALAAYVIYPFTFEENFSHATLIRKPPRNNSFLDSLQTTILIC